MKLFSLLVLLLAVGGCLSSISNINLSPTGNFAKLSTKQGLWTSVVLLQFLILGQLGVIPYKFKGRKKRDLDPQALVQESNAMLKLIRSLDHRDCLLRYLCELEAARIETKNTGVALDADVESDMILLNIAKRKMHPAVLMQQDPGSPVLPFEVAVFTGKDGSSTCASVFHSCPYNMTQLQACVASPHL